MAGPAVPRNLEARGRRLWRDVVKHLGGELDPAQRELLVEACRLADRLDRLDRECRGERFARFVRELDENGDDGETLFVLKVDGALAAASRDANVLKQLLVALRLPDEATGAKPQRRGARGGYAPSPARAGSASARLAAVRSAG